MSDTRYLFPARGSIFRFILVDNMSTNQWQQVRAHLCFYGKPDVSADKQATSSSAMEQIIEYEIQTSQLEKNSHSCKSLPQQLSRLRFHNHQCHH